MNGSELLKLIEQKIKLGGKTPELPTATRRPSSKVIDLVKVLQESLEHSDKRKAAGKKPKTARAGRRSLKKAA